MKPHWWLEFRSPKRLLAFTAAVGAAVLMWRYIPSELLRHYSSRHGINPIELMFTAWLTGWFGLLFLKMEDLNVLAPLNYQRALELVSILFIALAVLLAIGLLASVTP